MLSKAVIERNKHVGKVEFENGATTRYYTNEDKSKAIEDIEFATCQKVIAIKDIKEELK